MISQFSFPMTCSVQEIVRKSNFSHQILHDDSYKFPSSLKSTFSIMSSWWIFFFHIMSVFVAAVKKRKADFFSESVYPGTKPENDPSTSF